MTKDLRKELEDAWIEYNRVLIFSSIEDCGGEYLTKWKKEVVTKLEAKTKA